MCRSVITLAHHLLDCLKVGPGRIVMRLQPHSSPLTFRLMSPLDLVTRLFASGLTSDWLGVDGYEKLRSSDHPSVKSVESGESVRGQLSYGPTSTDRTSDTKPIKLPNGIKMKILFTLFNDKLQYGVDLYNGFQYEPSL